MRKHLTSVVVVLGLAVLGAGAAPSQQDEISVEPNDLGQIPSWSYASEPAPASGAVDVDPSVVLSWQPGSDAAWYEVHLDTDANAVAAGQACVAIVEEPSYDTYELDLQLGRKYYWMIEEVNEARTPASWTGDVWDFNTPEFLVVDDMESYDDDANNIAYGWVGLLDGDYSYDPSQYPYDPGPPYTDRDIAHSGKQSMRFIYGRYGEVFSEADRAFDGNDWTRAGARTLVIWFRGDLGNNPGQLYAKINNTTVNYTGSTGSLAAPVWKQWNIDLASVGYGVRNVTLLSLGVSGYEPGYGTLYFDDIRLYADAEPATGDALDPNTDDLEAYYPMDDSIADASGHDRDGAIYAGAGFGEGPIGYGPALVLDGIGGYAGLPIGSLIESMDSATIAAWVNGSDTNDVGCRIFDFGTDMSSGMFLTPNSGDGTLRFSIAEAAGAGEFQLNRSAALESGWQHVAIVIDGAAGQMRMYVDGTLVDEGPTEALPKDLGHTNSNYIGRSRYVLDPYFSGSIDEFRIYGRALSTEEIQYLVGDR